jgi:transcriptional antiterminator NusG
MGKKLLKIHRVDFKNEEVKYAWYTIVTIPGHERKVAEVLRNRFNNMGSAEHLKEVFAPIREWEETVEGRLKKDGTRTARKVKKSENLLVPGYLFIHMIMNNDTWNIVRQTTGVAGWLKNADGMPGDTPIEDILKWKDAMGMGKEARAEIAKEFTGKIGDFVKVMEGPFKGLEGKISDIGEVDIELSVDALNGARIEISPTLVETI